MLDLYQIVGKSFFNILASKNKETYLECLFLLHDVLDDLYEDGENNKPYITTIIEEQIGSKLDSTIYDDDDMILHLRNNREKASYILNLFIRQKWLFEEDLGNYSVAINFYDHSSRVLRTLKEIQNNDDTEYTGLISSIYFSLKNFSSKDIGQFEQIYRRTDELIGNLKTLRSNIYLYYNDMVKNKSKENLEELFTQLIDYKKNFFDKAFYNLQTKDTLKKYKYDILAYLNDIQNNNFVIEQLSNLSIGDKYITYEEANEFIILKLHSVSAAFENIDRLNQSIVERSEQYLNALISKIQFILNRSEDVEGIFNQLFDSIINDEIEEFSFINFVDTKALDRASLFTPRKVTDKIESSVLPVEFIAIDDIIKDRTIKGLLSNRKYSINAINKYVEDILKTDLKVKASNIDMNSYEDYIYLILIYLYSKNPEATFRTNKLGYTVNLNSMKFKNFEIVRK